LLHPFINVLHWYTIITPKTTNESDFFSRNKNVIMPSSSTKAAETMTYNTVRTAPFTQIHGHPTRQDYKTLKQEASDLAIEVDNITFACSRDTATGEEYGLLAEIIGDAKYAHITNLNWTQ
jgi:hypothetical protein